MSNQPKNIRGKNIATPIIMLTARDSVKDKVEGLDSGANDYLSKPFLFEELLAPICVKLRSTSTLLNTITIADLSIDTARLEAKRGDKKIHQNAKELADLLFSEFLIDPLFLKIIYYNKEKKMIEHERISSFEMSCLFEIPLNEIRHLKSIYYFDKFIYRVSYMLIPAKRLSNRISTENIPSEIEELLSTFNHLLNNLEDSFSHDASHELKTPLTAIHDYGINAEDLPFMLDRFYKAYKALSRKDADFGLGLSIVKMILDIHNYNIQLKSVKDIGTTVTIKVPKKELPSRNIDE